MHVLLIVNIFVGFVLGSIVFTDIAQYDKLVSISQTTLNRLFLLNFNTLEWVGAIYNNDHLEVTASHPSTCLFTIGQHHNGAPYHLNPVQMSKKPWEVATEAQIGLFDKNATLLILMPTKKKSISCRNWMKIVYLNRVMSQTAFLKWSSRPRNTAYAAVRFTAMLRSDSNALENTRPIHEEPRRPPRRSVVNRQPFDKPPVSRVPRKPPVLIEPSREPAIRHSSGLQESVSHKPEPNESVARRDAQDSFRTWSTKSVHRSKLRRNLKLL